MVYTLRPNGDVIFMTPGNYSMKPVGTWTIQPTQHKEPVKANTWGLNGDYVHTATGFHLIIQDSTFKMTLQGLTYGAGMVKQDGNQVILNDGKSIVVMDLKADGSLSTDTYGLAGTWEKQ